MTGREGRNYDGIDLKSKTAGYFTSTMGLLGKSGGIAFRISKPYKSHRQIQRTKGRNMIGKKGGSWEGLLF